MRLSRAPFWLAALTLGILAAWPAANLPALYARVKLDRSFPALSRYEFETTPEVVLVGSSMTVRLYEGYFSQPRPRNIAISGGSPLTGLSIIASYDSLPRLILVETNIMSRPSDAALIEQFGKDASEPYKWFRPTRALISLIYYWIKYKSEADNVARLPKLEPSHYDISESVSFTRKEYQSTKLDEGMARNTNVLKQLVAHLEHRGCKILLYELPYPDGIGETHYAVTAKNLVQAAFPDAEMWLKLDLQPETLRWVDASHMDERSAIIVAQEIEETLKTLGQEKTTHRDGQTRH